jgi:CHAT domain-containing protein
MIRIALAFALGIGLLTVLASSPGRAQSDPFEDCRRRVQEKRDDYDAYYCFLDVARATGLRSEAEAGLARLESGSPWATLVLGHAAAAVGDAQIAEPRYLKAVALFEAANIPLGAVIARTNLFRIYDNTGDAEAANEQVERVWSAHRDSQDPELAVRASLLRGNYLVFGAGGDLQEVEDIVKAGLAKLPPKGLEHLYEQLLELRMDAYRKRNRPDLVLRAAQDLMAFYENQPPSALTGQTALVIADATALLAQGSDGRPLAIERARRAVELTRQLEHKIIEGQASALLGALLAIDDAEASRALFERCRELAREVDLPSLRAECLFQMADRAPGLAPGEAERMGAEAIEISSQLGVTWQASAWQSQLRVLWRSRPPAAAWQASRPGLELQEALAAKQTRDVETAEVLRATQELGEWMVGRMLAQPQPMLAEAFELLERSRARALLTSVTNPNARLTDVPVIGLAELQRLLRPNQALILFQVARDRDVYGEAAGSAWAFSITRDRVHVARIPERRVLEARVPAVVGLLERRDETEARASAALTAEILSETLAALPPGVDELLISPDGVLHSLPFPALREARRGPTLGERFAIANVPSASLWAHWRRQSAPARAPRALVMADPAAAPGVDEGASLRAVTSLPGARAEGEWIARYFARGVELHVAADASEHRLKTAQLPRYGLFHFAVHAVADDAEPERSAVLLSPGDGDDGFLRPSEIAALPFDDSVVVLSACQGASGQAIAGEGVFSLSRAFLKAGADAVVGSLWPLRDEEARWFFQTFYRNLANGVSLSQAMQATRRQAVEARLPVHAWAGMILIGDGSPALDLARRAVALGWGSRE